MGDAGSQKAGTGGKADLRDMLAETIADVPSPATPAPTVPPAGPRDAREAHAHAVSPADRRPSPSPDPLGETLADVPSPTAPSTRPPAAGPAAARDWSEVGPTPTRRTDLRQIAADLDLDEIYDQSTPAREGDGKDLGLNDPEAGRGAVSFKAKRVRREVAHAVRSPFGLLIQGILLGLAGVTVAIYAIVDQTRVLIGIAAVVTPLTLLLVWNRYQRWLGHHRYMYKLLETMGEDTSGMGARQKFRDIPVRKRR